MRSGNLGLLAMAIVSMLLVTGYTHVTVGPAGDLDGEVYIIHTNDTHGYYDESYGTSTVSVLGFTAVAALKDDYESRGATVFLVDAGDAFQGTAATLITHGSSSVDVLNAMGYDLMVPGNHEFDYGKDRYLGYAAQLNFPTLCANIIVEETGDYLCDPYKVVERDGYTIGFFGLATPDTVTSVIAGATDGLEFTDPVVAAENMVKTLSSMDVDAVVCVGHIGVDRSSSITSDSICASVEGIDVFIDGHSHTVMTGGKVADGSVTLLESDTLIASTGCYNQHIGVVHMTAEGGPEAYLEDIAGIDPNVTAVIDRVNESINEQRNAVVGHTEVELSGGYLENRVHETVLGDFLADTMLLATGADVAVINGGAVRNTISVGEIIAGDVYSAYAFESQVLTKEVTGEQLRLLLEVWLSGLPSASGGFAQVSGMTVMYDSSATAGHRVESVMVNGTPLDLSATYVLASNDFVMAGSSGYEWMGNIPTKDSFGSFYDIIFDRLDKLDPVKSGDIVIGRLIDTAA